MTMISKYAYFPHMATRAWAAAQGSQILKPKPAALSSHTHSLSLAWLERAGFGRLSASSPSPHITRGQTDSGSIVTLDIISGVEKDGIKSSLTCGSDSNLFNISSPQIFRCVRHVVAIVKFSGSLLP
jgi:hypothetical protein